MQMLQEFYGKEFFGSFTGETPGFKLQAHYQNRITAIDEMGEQTIKNIPEQLLKTLLDGGEGLTIEIVRI